MSQETPKAVHPVAKRLTIERFEGGPCHRAIGIPAVAAAVRWHGGAQSAQVASTGRDAGASPGQN